MAAERLAFKLCRDRGQARTIIGGLSSDGTFFHDVINSTNKEACMQFFQRYLEHVGNLDGVVFVLDNHRAHVSVVKMLQEHGATVLMLPKVSCFFSPIEALWGHIKRQWRTHVVTIESTELTVEYMERRLKPICDSIPRSTLQNFARHALTVLKEYCH